MILTQFVPAIYAEQCLDLNESYTLPDYMDAALPHVPEWFYVEQFFTNLLNKNPYLDAGYDPDAEAYKLFHLNEGRCRMLNERFPQLLGHPVVGPLMVALRKTVHYVLGSSPRDIEPRVTTGATTTTPRGTNVVTRFAKGAITSRLQSFLLSFGPPDPRWIGAERAPIIDYVVADTVLKTAKISRLIGKENCHNMFWQAGLADCITKRLRDRAGINMSTAQETHRFVAMMASITGHYTTDDLVSGSHFLYNSLMRYLLPSDWLRWTDSTRSENIRIGDNVIELEHYMPNGNGFCAALQTVVFWSVIKVCQDLEGAVPSPIFVYGDDLLYDTKISARVRWFMKTLGFITNTEKSFNTGFFRESCGGDYVNGHFIRPFYAKLEYSNSHEKTILANAIRKRYGEKPPYQIRRFWLLLVRSIPHAERLWGPAAMGDDCLHTNRQSLIRRIDRKGRTEIRCWSRLRKKSLSFERISVGSLSPQDTTKLLSHGYMAGWGGHGFREREITPLGHHAVQLAAWKLQWQKNEKTLKDNGCPLSQSVVNSRLRIVASSDRYSKSVPKSFRFFERIPSYNVVEVNSSDDVYVPKPRAYYEVSNGVDEMEPLSIFAVLCERAMREKRIINCAVPNHGLWHSRAKNKQLNLLLAALRKRKDALSGYILAQQGSWTQLEIDDFAN